MPKNLNVIFLGSTAETQSGILSELEKGGWSSSAHQVGDSQSLLVQLDLSDWDILFTAGAVPTKEIEIILTAIDQRSLSIPVICLLQPYDLEVANRLMNSGAYRCLPEDRLALLRPCVQACLSTARPQKRNFHDPDPSTENQALYRSIIEKFPDLIALTDLSGKLMMINSVGVKLLGYSTAEDIIGKDVDEFILPEDRKKGKWNSQVILNDSVSIRFELNIIRHDGHQRIVEINSVLIRDAAGRPSGYIGIGRDITDRKKAEQSLQMSELRYQTIIEDQTDLICRFFPDGIISYANHAYCRYFGVTREEFQGRSFIPYILDTERPLVIDAIASVTVDHPVTPYIHRVRRADGNIRWNEWIVRGIFTDNGKIVEYQSVGRDITPRVVAEDEIKHLNIQLEQRVQERTTQLQAMYEDLKCEIAQRKTLEHSWLQLIEALSESPDIVGICTDQGELTYLNKAGRQILQVDLHDSLSGIFIDSACTDGSKHIIRETALPKAISEGLWRGEIEFSQQDGSILTVSQVIAAHRDAHGKVDFLSWLARDISEIRLAQQKLSENEERLHSLTDHMLDMITQLSPDGCIEYASPSHKMVLGYPANELMGKSVFDLIHPKDVDRVREVMAKNGLKLAPVHFEARYRHAAGHYLCLETYGTFLTDSQGLVKGIIFGSRDVTEKKRVEDALRESEQRFRGVFEASTIGISITSLDGKPLQFNSSFQRMFGYDEEELRHTRFMEATHPDDLEAHMQFVKEVYAKQRDNFTLEQRYFKKNGDILWGRLNVSMVRNPSGEPLFAISMVEDITERKRAEETLQKTEEELQHILKISPVALYSSEATYPYKITFMSENVEYLTGFSANEFVQEPRFWLDHIHPEDREKVLQGLQFDYDPSHMIEYRFKKRSGDYCWLLDEMNFHYDDHGNITEIVGVVTDISRRKQADNELRIALEKEKELSELKSRFVSMTSHEFRTPLSTILSSAELLEHYGPKWPDKKMFDHLHRIQQSVGLLTSMLDEFLMIGRIDSGQTMLSPRWIDLVEFSSGLIEEVKITDGEKHPILLTIDADPSQIFLDERSLRTVLTNLLTNAVKFSEPGKTIQVTVRTNPACLHCCVQDHGIGIPSSELDLLFQPFHRARNVSHIPGSGLGLTIVKKVLDQIGGKIEVSSQETMGTTFRVDIPLIEPSA